MQTLSFFPDDGIQIFSNFQLLQTKLQFALLCMQQCTLVLVYFEEQILLGGSMIMSILYFIGNILSVVVLTPLTTV